MPLYIHFLEVGQGDATYLRYETPGEPPRHILVDGGPGGSAERLIRYLRQEGVSRLHLVVATHVDDGHLGGLGPVVEEFPVARFWGPDPQRHDALRPLLQQSGLVVSTAPCEDEILTRESLSTYDHLHAVALNRNALVEYPLLGHDASYLFPGLELRVMGPAPHFAGPLHAPLLGQLPAAQLGSVLASDANNSSLVLRVGLNGQHVLLPGDAELPAWHAMIEYRGAGLHARVLKVSQHGSLSGTNEELVGFVRPRQAILSVGLNSSEHPAPQVLNVLAPPIQVYRTDQHGDIVLRFDESEQLPPPPSRAPWQRVLNWLRG